MFVWVIFIFTFLAHSDTCHSTDTELRIKHSEDMKEVKETHVEIFQKLKILDEKMIECEDRNSELVQYLLKSEERVLATMETKFEEYGGIIQ